MPYINTETGEALPYEALRQLHPNVSFPAEGAHLPELGFVYSAPPPPEPGEPEPRRIAKVDLLRLFKPEEVMAFNRARRQIATLEVSDYAVGQAVNPVVALEAFLLTFDAVDVIELDHPDTAMGVGLLAMNGVFGSDPQPRMAAILAGEPPSP